MNGNGSHQLLEFGVFTLDPVKRRLTGAAGEPVAITAKAFDALVHLVEHAGETVSRSHLSRALWPQVVVEDNNLSQTILALRRALGDTADGQQFILTIPRHGYRFVADVVRREAREAALPSRPKRFFWAATASAAIGAAAVTLLSGRPQDPLARPAEVLTRTTGTASTAAYGQYLKAVALYRSQGGIGVSVAPVARNELLAHLDEALRTDPNFPAALGWKAHTELDQLLFDPAPQDAWPQQSAKLQTLVETHARQALAGDPLLGIAHTTLARLAMYRGRLDEAEDHLQRALKSNPNDSMVLHYSAILYCLKDEHDQAIRAARRALDLDPRNPAPFSPLVLSLIAKGEHAAAAGAARHMIEVAPSAVIGYVILARTQTHGNAAELAEARESLRIAEQFLDDSRNFRVDAALSYARAGERANAARLVSAFRDGTGGHHVDPALDAMALLALGEHDRARERLENAVRHRGLGMDPLSLLLIRRNAWSDPLLESTQWQDLRNRLRT